MHDVRPLECDRARHLLSVWLDDELSRFERLLVDTHLARCGTCRAFEARVTALTETVRAAPFERLQVPIELPSRTGVAWRSVARATSVGAAAVTVLAFLGFAASPDRASLSDDHALIAAALDRPAGTNDLLIDVVRPALVARTPPASASGADGIGAHKPPLQPGA